jgi:hypothetical protein
MDPIASPQGFVIFKYAPNELGKIRWPFELEILQLLFLKEWLKVSGTGWKKVSLTNVSE